MTTEATLFVRMAIFGIGAGVAYWFLTYETAGTVMLTAFGGASGIAALAILVGARGRRHLPREAEPSPGAPVEGEVQPVPRPGWAPLGIAIGLGGVALAGPFGPWLAIAGLFLAIRSAKSWLDAQMEETERAHQAERRVVSASPPDRPRT